MPRLSQDTVRRMMQREQEEMADDIAIECLHGLNLPPDEAEDADADSRIEQRSCHCHSTFPRISAAIAESDAVLADVDERLDLWFENQRLKATLARLAQKGVVS